MMRTSSEILYKLDNYTKMLFHEFVGKKNKNQQRQVFVRKILVDNKILKAKHKHCIIYNNYNVRIVLASL